MHRSKHALFVVLAAITVVFASGNLFATTFTTLNDPLAAVGYTVASGISGNNVVGWYVSPFQPVFRGFLYNGSTYTPIQDDVAPYGTLPNGISGNMVVGIYYDQSNVAQGFLYNLSNGSFNNTLNDPFAGATGGTFPEGVSGNTVVGYYEDGSGVSHGFLFNIATNAYRTLDDPLAPTSGMYAGTQAGGISGNNVVGYYYDTSGHPNGFLYNILTSTYTTLDDPLGAGGVNQGTVATSISGSNVVGFYVDSSNDYHGFFYDGSTYTSLDEPLTTPQTVPGGISGDNVVGYYDVKLDVGYGTAGFIATVPEPSTFVLFGFGAIGMAIVARRKIHQQASEKH